MANAGGAISHTSYFVESYCLLVLARLSIRSTALPSRIVKTRVFHIMETTKDALVKESSKIKQSLFCLAAPPLAAPIQRVHGKNGDVTEARGINIEHYVLRYENGAP